MSIEVKICGVTAPEAVAAAVAGGADYIGFVFYPRSPRYVTPEAAHALAAQAPARVTKVGLAVDLDDGALAAILEAVPLDMWQLHGGESPARVAQIKERFGLPVMKVVKIAERADLAVAEPYFRVADRLLFDTKPPKEMTGALPGGNALAFDWHLLADKTWPLPWMLSGGLDRGNVTEAARISGARAVDVSSGIEDRPGLKNPDKIRAFLAAAKGN
jgi:phosphoribosylanthranilate isomerase